LFHPRRNGTSISTSQLLPGGTYLGQPMHQPAKGMSILLEEEEVIKRDLPVVWIVLLAKMGGEIECYPSRFSHASSFWGETPTIYKAIPCGHRGPPRGLDCTSNDNQFLRNTVQMITRRGGEQSDMHTPLCLGWS